MEKFLRKVVFLAVLSAVVLLSSCGKDHDDNGNIGDKVKTAKITLRITGGNSKNLTIAVGGANTQGEANLWKVDGVASNEAAILFDKDDFPGTGSNTHTLELTKAANNISLNISAGTFTGGTNYKFYYKVEVNGAVKDEATVTITADTDFTKNLRYTE